VTFSGTCVASTAGDQEEGGSPRRSPAAESKKHLPLRTAAATTAEFQRTSVVLSFQPIQDCLSSIFAKLIVRRLDFDFLSRAQEQIILESQPEIFCFTALFKIGGFKSSGLEAFAVDNHQLLAFLLIQ